MARRTRRNCFYCNASTQRGTRYRHNGMTRTIDHVYPRSGRQMHGMSTRQQQLNCVVACQKCNVRKGNKHPLSWLVIMHPFGVEATVKLLFDIGIDDAEHILRALTRRRVG
jgi:hypothetical protein